MHVHGGCAMLAPGRSTNGRPIMTATSALSARELLTHRWFFLPAVSGPLGGGLIKLGGGNTWAAVAVGAAPYAVCTLACSIFLIGYLAALIRYVCSGPEGQESMERLIAISANSVVGILTLTCVKLPSRPRAAGDSPRRHTRRPASRRPAVGASSTDHGPLTGNG
jgi:hypothetical protein